MERSNSGEYKLFNQNILQKTLEQADAYLEAVTDSSVERAAETEDTQEDLQTALKETVNPYAKLKDTQKPRAETNDRLRKAQKSSSSKPLPTKEIQEEAKRFCRDNQEFKEDDLVELRQKLKKGASKEEILELVASQAKDAAQTDALLEFLYATTTGEDQKQISEIRQEHANENTGELKAARNTEALIRNAKEKGLGTPVELRALYQEFTKADLDTNQMFDRLTTEYNDYPKIELAIKYLHKSLAVDGKSEGPSIEPAKLQDRNNEIRMLQAILGTYKWTQISFSRVESEAARSPYN